jgi:hypothetical protein
MQSNRNWFPYISVGMTVLLALLFATKFWGDDLKRIGDTFQDKDTPSLSKATSAVTDESYRAAVTSVLTAYMESKDAKSTYNALVLLRVPGSMQEVHYSLVVAFGKLASGEKTDGEARLSALKAENSWLPL